MQGMPCGDVRSMQAAWRPRADLDTIGPPYLGAARTMLLQGTDTCDSVSLCHCTLFLRRWSELAVSAFPCLVGPLFDCREVSFGHRLAYLPPYLSKQVSK